MLKRESQLRLWDENQKFMAQAEELGFRDWMEVVEILQYQVCEEFGFLRNMKLGLTFLRSIWTLYPKDTELHSVAHWIKFNRAAPCPVTRGTEAPNVLVYPLLSQTTSEDSPCPLFNPNSQRKQLIVSSSYS